MTKTFEVRIRLTTTDDGAEVTNIQGALPEVIRGVIDNVKMTYYECELVEDDSEARG